MSRSKCRTISILTWNVWFDFLELQTRTDLIIKEILRAKPDVVCLQEVLPLFEKSLRKNSKLTAIYAFSPFEPAHGYGNITLVKKDLKPKFSIIPFPTKMGRKLTLASVSIGSSNPVEMVVGNIHLESLNNQSLRQQQLEVCRNSLPVGRSVLVGDFNISAEDAKYRARAGIITNDTDSEDSWSSHGASEPAAKKAGDGKVPHSDKRDRSKDRSNSSEASHPPLENDVILRVLPGFGDAWHDQAEVLCALLEMKEETGGTYQSRSGDGYTDKDGEADYSDEIYRAVDEMGYTYDEAINNKSHKAALHRKRIDRVLTSLQAEKFEFVHMMRIGTTIRSSSAGGRVRTIFPSDHFGLLYTCLVRYG